MVPVKLKVLEKFGLCSNCSQKLVECSLARARKIFATARMLAFSLKFPYGKTVSGNMHPGFADVLLKLTHGNNREQSRDMGACRVVLLFFDLQSLSELYGCNLVRS